MGTPLFSPTTSPHGLLAPRTIPRWPWGEL